MAAGVAGSGGSMASAAAGDGPAATAGSGMVGSAGAVAGGAGQAAGGVAGSAPAETAGSAPGGASSSGGTASAGTSSGGAAGNAGSGGGKGSEVAVPKGGVCGTAWTNPGKQGVHDPSIVKEGDTYYLFRTGGFGFSTSKDLLTWSNGGSALPKIPAWTANLGLSDTPSLWAPDAQFVNGRAYIYYSVSAWGDVTHSAIGLATSGSFDPKSPNYNWVDQGMVVGSPEGGSGVNVIDANLLVDDDGSFWLVYGSFHKGIRLIELNPQTGLAKTKPLAPITLTTSLGEGSSLIKANGYYFLFVSRGHCCDGLKSTYEVVYGRSTKVTGPYVNRNGEPMNAKYEKLLAAGADGNPGQGGQSFFKENGQWFINYHAYQPPSGGSVLNVRPVYFDDAGWPTFDICKAKGYQK